MIRLFCDFCGGELAGDAKPDGGALNCPDSRLGVEVKTKDGHTLKIEVMHSINGTANAGHVCKWCILDALYRLDTRPKKAKAT